MRKCQVCGKEGKKVERRVFTHPKVGVMTSQKEMCDECWERNEGQLKRT